MSVYIAGVMSVFKPLLFYGMKHTRVDGLPLLLHLLHRQGLDRNRGLITISNHISTLDDPMMWGMMPFRTYFDTRTVRWTMGAADILFTNRWISPLFQHGQVIKTVRGAGIYQSAMELALEKLDDSQWVHVFPEGRVNQAVLHGSQPAQDLLRFKWGVSRLVLESKLEPIILPIWLTGFDQVMPEGRRPPFHFLPRLNQSVAIKISNPINLPWSSSPCSDDDSTMQVRQNQQMILEFRNRYRGLLSSCPAKFDSLKDHQEAKQIRMELASLLHSQLLAIRP